MSRDRLQQMRQNAPPSSLQQQDDYSYPPMRQTQNSYQSDYPSGGGGGGAGRPAGTGGLPSGPRAGGPRPSANSGSGYGSGGGGGGGGGGGYREKESGGNQGGRRAKRGSGYSFDDKGEVRNDMQGFFDTISDIQQTLKDLSSSLRELGSLQNQLSNIPSTSPDYSALQSDVTGMTSKIRSQISSTKRTLQNLTSETKSLSKIPGAITQSDVDLRLNQMKVQQQKLVSLVEEFGNVERMGREGERRKLERQIRIVDPSLSDYEIKGRVDEALRSGNDGVFAQALSNRQGAARGALDEVRKRQEEIAQIERTLVELAELFNDLSIRVEQQDEVIIAIEKNTEVAQVDMQSGLKEVEKAVVSARGARKKRIICFVIFIIILIVVGVVVAIKVVNGQKK